MWYERGWQWAKEHLTITVPGALLIFAATYMVMLAVDAGEVGAAWVQAVGSVTAILVAVRVSQKETRDRERDRIEESCVYMQKAFHVSAYVTMSVIHAADDAIKEKLNSKKLRFHIDVIKGAIDDMEEVEVMRFSSEDAVHAFLAVKRNGLLTIGALEGILAGDHPGDERVVKWKTNIDESSGLLSKSIVNHIKQYDWLVDRIPE
ncbi:hypothetical protein [Ectopseudomonas khazarica]|uniref:hypothetical protein n=1 Tax=Ectopseudomonas khazarica TaxID=2502979 RepID=UPI003A912C39